MSGFLNANGTSLGLYGQFISLNMSDDEAAEWAGVESLAIYDPFDEERIAHEIDIHESDGDTDLFGIELVELDTTGIIDLDAEDNPHRDFHPIYFDDNYYGWYPLPERGGVGVIHNDTEVYSVACEQFGIDCYVFEEDFEDDDVEEPGFRTGVRYNRPLTMWEEDAKWYRKYISSDRCKRGRELSKFRIDGKRSRKDNRSHRFGNRQEFAEMRNFWSDRQEMWHELACEHNEPTIPTFGIEIVGLTDDEASYHEAESEREYGEYIRELERTRWYVSLEDDYSLFFDPIANADKVAEVWERHLFPERFEEYRPYRFSDYYDDFGYYDQFYEEPEDYRHCDEPDWDDFSFGPTLDEWEELDRLEIERTLDAEADRFRPSFGGSGRVAIRYYATEPRRGKMKRKYSKRSGFANTRLSTATVATSLH